jgi:hypothetical protein
MHATTMSFRHFKSLIVALNQSHGEREKSRSEVLMIQTLFLNNFTRLRRLQSTVSDSIRHLHHGSLQIFLPLSSSHILKPPQTNAPRFQCSGNFRFRYSPAATSAVSCRLSDSFSAVGRASLPTCAADAFKLSAVFLAASLLSLAAAEAPAFKSSETFKREPDF